ncbi:MAG: hypothetical protein AVDCRST_MAG01-01-3304 [uncultured Rubrobacteraceae bacterium]|uniref:Uncharacterized protein n=1 Tax=uncultured Rubrobacteraceae bacterium TaxID=349277 RepID=A0A6J4QCM8_9ACTN|nr:MAG: hypothetical protein AVDCRST_MAG01-01-3304 [uncultured Rubrobacteraceae bacterium]
MQPTPARTNGRPRSTRLGTFLGVAPDGREFWLLGGHVYSQPPSEQGTSHVCRLAAFNRMRRARRPRDAAAGRRDAF